ncbi:hypothetical protein [Crenobacter intestini]|uniref:Uncharacterized protein n=1 Tax=Crenobacter intestini TaxID=2563443 RepID=A0A4V4N6Y1_9NEIS|nr:hypothetical protein [Crenobacter intestini]TIC78483.1 hypothetical protein E5K04_16020 [Crenobacter intestini]
MTQSTNDEIDPRVSRMRAAHQTLRDAGQNSLERGQENLLTALTWIYRWGWTTSDMLNRVLGRTSGGYALRQEKRGLLRGTATASGVPKKFYTLTEGGLIEASRHSDERIPYDLDPYRVNQNLIRHDLIAQNIVLKILNNGQTADYITERQQRIKYQNGEHKIFDAIVIDDDGRRNGIEVELTKKFDRQRDQFVRSICDDLMSGHVSRVLIVSDSNAILRDYKLSFEPGAELPIWEKNNRAHYAVARREKIPAEIDGKIHFIPLGQ